MEAPLRILEVFLLKKSSEPKPGLRGGAAAVVHQEPSGQERPQPPIPARGENAEGRPRGPQGGELSQPARPGAVDPGKAAPPGRSGRPRSCVVPASSLSSKPSAGRWPQSTRGTQLSVPGALGHPLPAAGSLPAPQVRRGQARGPPLVSLCGKGCQSPGPTLGTLSTSLAALAGNLGGGREVQARGVHSVGKDLGDLLWQPHAVTMSAQIAA